MRIEYLYLFFFDEFFHIFNYSSKREGLMNLVFDTIFYIKKFLCSISYLIRRDHNFLLNTHISIFIIKKFFCVKYFKLVEYKHIEA